MFDTMTITKLSAGLFGALLVFMLGGWLSQSIYMADNGHGDEDGHGQAYVIDTGADESEVEEEVEVDFASLMLAADPDKGERVFGKCKACHKLEAGENSVGPHLYGVVGREVDAVEGFSYSGALEAAADVWTPENLYAFLEDPRGYAPGTSMSFNGLNKSEDRVNVIAYLDLTDGEMTPVEAAVTQEEDVVTEEAATEETATEETATEEPVSEETVVEEPAATEETSTEDTATEETTTEESAAEETTSEDAVAEETATEETVTEEPAATESADGGDASGFAALVAAADLSDGERAFNKCKACHVLEAGVNRVGPSLYGVVGSEIASVEGFRYSDVLLGLEGNWTYDELSAFLEDPRGYARGTKMSFAGLKNEDERAAVIAYMESVSE